MKKAVKNDHSLIIGGGIVGAVLALKLAQAGHGVTLIDARPKMTADDWQQRLTQRDARVYALSLASIELLKEVGAWQLICQSGRKADYSQMLVWQKDGHGELQFGESEGVPQLLGSMVEPIVIEHALWQRMQDAQVSQNLQVIAGQKVTAMDCLGSADGYQ